MGSLYFAITRTYYTVNYVFFILAKVVQGRKLSQCSIVPIYIYSQKMKKKNRKERKKPSLCSIFLRASADKFFCLFYHNFCYHFIYSLFKILHIDYLFYYTTLIIYFLHTKQLKKKNHHSLSSSMPRIYKERIKTEYKINSDIVNLHC